MPLGQPRSGEQWKELEPQEHERDDQAQEAGIEAGDRFVTGAAGMWAQGHRSRHRSQEAHEEEVHEHGEAAEVVAGHAG